MVVGVLSVRERTTVSAFSAPARAAASVSFQSPVTVRVDPSEGMVSAMLVAGPPDAQAPVSEAQHATPANTSARVIKAGCCDVEIEVRAS